MDKLFVVAKFEYLKTVRRKAFWFATLFMPVLILVIMIISTASSIEGSKKLESLTESITSVAVIDKVGVVNPALIADPIYLAMDIDLEVEKVKTSETDLLIVFPEDLFENQTFVIYARDQGVFQNLSLNSFAQGLIMQSGYLEINNPKVISQITSNFNGQINVFDDNNEQSQFGTEQFILPGISIMLFFLSVFISGQYMLQSVAEEKENRMIENLLSIVDSKSLIFGKLLGLSGAAFTQLFIWASAGGTIFLLGASYSAVNINIDFSKIPLTLIPINLLFIILGFLFFASVMTGIGAIGTSYKDSQSLSSIFVILSILPLYFVTILVSDPNGVIAQIASYFPFTSAMIFMIRNSITDLSTIELLFGILINLIYVALAGTFAIKFFNLGSLMYNRRPKLPEIIHILKRS